MQQLTKLSVSVLKVHPRNQEFFDDIKGSDYSQFKKSIEEDGIITPLTVSSDMTVVSGHQRLKAAMDLGIKQVPVIIREDLDDEDEKLKKLLASNFGRIRNDPTKQRKVAVQYVELCGLKNGQKNEVHDNRVALPEIAKQLGISKTTLEELLLIERKLTPEMKELVDEGKITKTTASKVLSKLTKTQQEELIAEFGKDYISSLTQKKVEELISNIKEEKEDLEKQLKEERNKEPESIDNTDYITIDKLNEELEKLKNDKKYYEDKTGNLQEQLDLYKKDSDEYEDLKNKIYYLTKQKDDISRQIASTTYLASFVVDIENLLKNQLAPIKYSRALLEMKDNETIVNNVLDILNCVEIWCSEIRGCLPKENDYIIIESEGI